MKKKVYSAEEDESVINLNKELLNKRVYINLMGGWYGIVKNVIDSETFLIESDGGMQKKVDIHHVRCYF
jgi:preprotein translocase subunit YajC